MTKKSAGPMQRCADRLLLVLGVSGVGAVVHFRISRNPVKDINLAGLFVPCAPALEKLASFREPLGVVIASIVAVTAAVLAWGLVRSSHRWVRWSGAVIFVGSLYLFGALGFVADTASLADVGDGFARTLVSLILLPPAMVLHGTWLITGWPALLLPIVVIAFVGTGWLPERRERIEARRVLLGAFAVTVFGALAIDLVDGAASAFLNQYLVRIMGRGTALTVLLLLTAITAFSLARRVTRLAGIDWNRFRRLRRNGRHTDHRKHGDEGAGHGGATDQADSVPPKAILNLNPPGMHDSFDPASSAVDTTGNAEIGLKEPPNPELQHAIAEIASAATRAGLSITPEQRVSGPATVAFYYRIPDTIATRSVRRSTEDLRRELDGRFVLLPDTQVAPRQIGIVMRRADPRPLPFAVGLPDLKRSAATLPVFAGHRLDGEPLMFDLARLPHLLVAGTTGSGKSVFLHVIIRSLLAGAQASNLRLVLIDPKRVEFSPYSSVPNLACPVINEPREAVAVLAALNQEMERRYDALSKGNGQPHPFIVAVIDEVADLFLSEDGKTLRDGTVELAQKSRAVGIHLVLATQRPSHDVIEGRIKANFPGRAAFRTVSQTDSRVILDSGGAEDLFGRGDGLFLCPEFREPVRFQSAYVG